MGAYIILHKIKAPAFIPAKAKFMIRDCKLIAEKNKLNLNLILIFQ